MKRILMLAFAATLAMGASACQDTTSPGAVLAGTYTLRTINNQAPPVVYADPTGSSELLGGQIQIDRNGTFTDVLTWRDTPPGGVPGAPYDDTVYGTWSLSGNTLTFIDASDPSNQYSYTVSGNQLVYSVYASGTSYSWVYSK